MGMTDDGDYFDPLSDPREDYARKSALAGLISAMEEDEKKRFGRSLARKL